MNADWMQSKLECQNFSASAEAEWEGWKSQDSRKISHNADDLLPQYPVSDTSQY